MEQTSSTAPQVHFGVLTLVWSGIWSFLNHQCKDTILSWIFYISYIIGGKKKYESNTNNASFSFSVSYIFFIMIVLLVLSWVMLQLVTFCSQVLYFIWMSDKRANFEYFQIHVVQNYFSWFYFFFNMITIFNFVTHLHISF